MMTNVEYALAGSLLLMVVVNIALLATLIYLNNENRRLHERCYGASPPPIEDDE